MTQITGFVKPARRSGELGVHSVDHFNMVVPDLKQAEMFYTAFGLDIREEGNSLGLYTVGHGHRWGRIGEGSSKKLTYVSFGAFEDDIERFRVKLQQSDVKQLDPPAGFETNGIWFRDPDGILIEIRVAEKTSPNEKSSFLNPSPPPGVQGAPKRSQAPLVRPRRLAHILIFTSDVSRAINFYSTVVGLRLSDRSGDGIAFMHGIHGSDHHMIALAKSNAPGLHHLSWDVGSINEVGLGAMQMADKGFAAGWGLGRHVLGSNYFHYVRDPWGSYSEYSSDIDYIPVDQDWKGADHPAEDAFSVGPDAAARLYA
ncbi:VOC family protein [Pseudorhodoplanes sinuspersici]|uniref:VOC family protein n=1 Tax=Pseudorhodoplanes sinuspersici TaxID=1235591 RepID=UPI000FEE994F|nr:VOC family protein [Pseudorhodoplanes sinuspersici]RKE68416.1 catechol-2,3-dioxygenase [Pseudorhodoplanes sinuspersici]